MPALRERQGIEIDYVAGFGTDPADMPVDIVQALLLLVGYWYEHLVRASRCSDRGGIWRGDADRV